MISDLERTECFKILNNNYIGHLAYVYHKQPFVIPITYYYDKTNITVIGYTGEGHKTHALRLNNAVALEIAEIQAIDNWKTVLIQGTFEELVGPEAKYELHKFSLGVKKLIKGKDNIKLDFIPQFSSKTNPEAIPIVYHINIQEITGKQRNSKRDASLPHLQKDKNKH
tara:strand:+ start:8080 stop:8583 length:504 start_codon:yes stop_codon:yes gene_type:complete